ncbi:phosphoribosylanthranilate isomerase [Govanella unica]|uniref:N-(5'-phosphoribosyl)anthranilate isomerase n=1 Tax=Govanella unica TaxID=2975056 RepID=A0A9X3Z7V5_9PROT|nr:phosphoribosylanthranilate isomerase [Govania unica]MDA5194582.1 phosphoribosylanthranilate isomerase [Govania unica]
MSVSAKICGLTTPEAVAEAVRHGADYLGFVFYPRSPRALSYEAAAQLAAVVPAGVKTVALFVDPSDADIAAALQAHAFDLLQLHGNETPERIAALRARFGRPVIKAIPVSGLEDIEKARQYIDVADMLLFDAKAPKSMADALPGGNGLSFDWELLASHWTSDKPWMLSGGLDADCLEDAVTTSGATRVDVSSGVEERPGIKSLAKIRAFLAVAARL